MITAGRTSSSATAALRAVILAGVLALAACDEFEMEGRTAQERYETGLQLLSEGKTNDAGLAFRAAIELDDSHVASRLELARVDETRDWLAAVNGYRDVIALDPEQVEARVRLAHLMISAQDITAAENSARKAFELAPENAEVLAALALLEEAKGQTDAAEDWADRALAIDPENRTARLVKARLAAEAGEKEIALELIDALLADEPADMEINLLKLSLVKEAESDPALREHLAHMGKNFPDPWIRNWLAYLREQAGDLAGAHDLLKELADQQPNDLEAALAVVALVERDRGDAAARDEFEARIAAAEPAVALKLRLELAGYEKSKGRPEEEANVLWALIADAPTSIEANSARLRIARYRFASGDLGEARDLVDAALEHDPRRPDALGLRASLLLEEGRSDKAIEALRAGLAEAPQDVELSLMLARAYNLAGSRELARDRYAAATQDSGFDPEVVATYADFLLEADETEAAMYLLEAAAHKHPEAAEIRTKLESMRAENRIE